MARGKEGPCLEAWPQAMISALFFPTIRSSENGIFLIGKEYSVDGGEVAYFFNL